MTSNTSKSVEAAAIDLQTRDLLRDALAALEAIAEEGLNFATEQAAARVIAQIRAHLS